MTKGFWMGETKIKNGFTKDRNKVREISNPWKIKSCILEN
jgi:hypothetical protein